MKKDDCGSREAALCGLGQTVVVSGEAFLEMKDKESRSRSCRLHLQVVRLEGGQEHLHLLLLPENYLLHLLQ